MRLMDQLQISYTPTLPLPEVSAGGEPLLEGYAINLSELMASTRSSGDFWIFGCGCGVPGCGGIRRGVVVTHGDGETRWRVQGPGLDRDFTFCADDYEAAVGAAVEQAAAPPGSVHRMAA